jgi:hypothetical protein
MIVGGMELSGELNQGDTPRKRPGWAVQLSLTSLKLAELDGSNRMGATFAGMMKSGEKVGQKCQWQCTFSPASKRLSCPFLAVVLAKGRQRSYQAVQLLQHRGRRSYWTKGHCIGMAKNVGTFTKASDWGYCTSLKDIWVGPNQNKSERN